MVLNSGGGLRMGSTLLVLPSFKLVSDVSTDATWKKHRRRRWFDGYQRKHRTFRDEPDNLRQRYIDEHVREYYHNLGCDPESKYCPVSSTGSIKKLIVEPLDLSSYFYINQWNREKRCEANGIRKALRIVSILNLLAGNIPAISKRNDVAQNSMTHHDHDDRLQLYMTELDWLKSSDMTKGSLASE